MRWMSIDYGIRKIGIAFSDEVEITVSPFATWPNIGILTLLKLVNLSIKEHVNSIVVGLPLHKDGNYNETTANIINFGQLLQNNTRLPLFFWNESLTSIEARRFSIHDKKYIKDNTRIDAIAATLILEDLLSTKQFQNI